MVNIVIQSVAAKYNINNNANKQKQEMREHKLGENQQEKTVHTTHAACWNYRCADIQRACVLQLARGYSVRRHRWIGSAEGVGGRVGPWQGHFNFSFYDL